jgi:hypothetical protein
VTVNSVFVKSALAYICSPLNGFKYPVADSLSKAETIIDPREEWSKAFPGLSYDEYCCFIGEFETGFWASNQHLLLDFVNSFWFYAGKIVDYHLFEPNNIWVYDKGINILTYEYDPFSILRLPALKLLSEFLTVHGWWCGPLTLYLLLHLYFFIKLFTRFGWSDHFSPVKQVDHRWFYLVNIASLYRPDEYRDFLNFWNVDAFLWYLDSKYLNKRTVGDLNCHNPKLLKIIINKEDPPIKFRGGLP